MLRPHPAPAVAQRNASGSSAMPSTSTMKWTCGPVDMPLLPTGPPAFTPSHFVASECAKRGVMLATAPPNTLRLGPPLATSEEHIELGIAGLDAALGELDRVGAPALAGSST